MCLVAGTFPLLHGAELRWKVKQIQSDDGPYIEITKVVRFHVIIKQCGRPAPCNFHVSLCDVHTHHQKFKFEFSRLNSFHVRYIYSDNKPACMTAFTVHTCLLLFPFMKHATGTSSIGTGVMLRLWLGFLWSLHSLTSTWVKVCLCCTYTWKKALQWVYSI